MIDYYSARLAGYPVGGYGYIYLDTTVGGAVSYYPIVPEVASALPYNQMTRIFADPGTILTVRVAYSSGTKCQGDIILSGHFVDVK